MDVRKAKRKGYVLTPDGRQLKVPQGWKLLPPGDAALTRRVKKDGDHWVVKELFKKRMISKGVYAPSDRIDFYFQQLKTERADPAYAKKLEAGRKSRAKKEEAYVEDFSSAVYRFLAFDEKYGKVAEMLSRLISKHATPVGSGTVARTKRIPIERRAEAATIAWLRHQTTAYDHMQIPKVKGKRREVRKMLADESRQRLMKYRNGAEIHASCPIWQAIKRQIKK